jgi:1-phosphatidylinositol-3-phosphate 5-kinase
LTLTPVEEVFELRVPRLQIIRAYGSEKAPDDAIEEETDHSVEPEDPKRTLRREIGAWWQGVGEHIDKLEESFIAERGGPSAKKSLPRLPSSVDPYDEGDEPTTPTAGAETPKAHTAGLPPPSSPLLVSRSPLQRSVDDSIISTASSTTDDGSSIADLSESHSSAIQRSNSTTQLDAMGKVSGSDPVELLSGLWEAFQNTERSLYAQLSQTPSSLLNDVRLSFLSAAQGTRRRLHAWQKKHLSKALKGAGAIGELSAPEPEWFKKGYHPVPRGSVIVREEDWGSIIAFTLRYVRLHHWYPPFVANLPS